MLHSKVGERVEVKLHAGLSKKEFQTLKTKKFRKFFSISISWGISVIFQQNGPPRQNSLIQEPLNNRLLDRWREEQFKLFLLGHNNLVYAEIIHDQVEHLRDRIYVAMSTVTP